MDFDFQEIKKEKGSSDRVSYKGIYLGKESLSFPREFIKLIKQKRNLKLYSDVANKAIAVQPVDEEESSGENVFRVSYSHNKEGKTVNGSIYTPRASKMFKELEQGRYYFKEITVDGLYVCVKE